MANKDNVHENRETGVADESKRHENYGRRDTDEYARRPPRPEDENNNSES